MWDEEQESGEKIDAIFDYREQREKWCLINNYRINKECKVCQ